MSRPTTAPIPSRDQRFADDRGFVTEHLGSTGTTRLRWASAVVVVLAYGYWFTDRQPFTGGADLALLVPIVGLLGIAETRRFRRRRSPRPPIASRRARHFQFAVVAWSAIASAALAWELLALRSSPRSQHPTISSLVETIEQHHLGRIVLFVAWLALGWTLAS
jgi:hypothetical protein